MENHHESYDELKDSLKSIVNSCEDPVKRAKIEAEMNGFETLWKAFVEGRGGYIDWSKINPPPQTILVPYSDIKTVSKEITPEIKSIKSSLLSKLCVIKLNGGLGTTMGCTGPKSIIEVTKNQTFLDLTVKQIEKLNKDFGTKVPLILMNSFNTHDESLKIVSKYKHQEIFMFNQSCYPRIYKDSLLPVPSNFNDEKSSWYPPGHGDIYEAFYNSGLMTTLAERGIEYAFISNIDNLGATVDFNILNHMVSAECEFIMEVTDKTRSDVKGGTLIDYEGKAHLLEIAQVAPENVDEFKSIKKFKIFNTNNLWVNIPAIKRLVEANEMRDMDVIINNKSVNGKAMIQLERASGAAIQFFKGSIGVNVSRSRFLPVKSTSDLFMLQSNLYTLADGSMVMNPKRTATFPTVPHIKLGESFSKVSDFLRRFKGIPDILELDHLTVSGDVTFGEGVILRGTVIIVANHGSRIDIPSGSILENKVVSGNLRILEH
eukprot:TRINITY_DN5274_c0_g1_i1.p1 TRINITY_DN5274_c0_g1~~TRINITY_DN5274_c0_g1_i1.p1  ORF type:complete len:501 (+),score=227.13 TRINITY_DN5274_c0_g1_i1:40-1503(+)